MLRCDQGETRAAVGRDRLHPLGLFPLYWPLLEPAGPLEILACRVVLSLVVVALLLAVRHQLRTLRRLDRGTVLRLCLAGLIIAVNWGAYIWGVNNGHVVETSLGYFINPLLTVALGVVVLHERLRRLQWVAVALGAVAVLILSVDYGRPPWLALFLAVSFATYGFIKKSVRATAPEGLLVEAAVLTVPALVFLGVLAATGGATWIGSAATPSHLLLLAAAGPATAIPLLFFAAAASRLPLEHHRAAPVPRPGHAVRDRGAGAPRADATRAAGRVRAGVAGAGPAHRRRAAAPPRGAHLRHRAGGARRGHRRLRDAATA